MKNLGLILVGGITVPILLLVGVYILWPQNVAPQPKFVISIDDELHKYEDDLATREAKFRNQLEELQQTLAQEQTTFESDTEVWQIKMEQAQNQLDALETQAQTLQQDVTRLAITRTTQSGQYQSQLSESQQQYEARINQLQEELKAAQAQLAELKAQVPAQ